MNPTKQRRAAILKYIQTHGVGEVTAFAREFQISAVTIRSDLNHLEKQGCVTRCYGGARLNHKFAFEQPLKDKKQLNTDIKAAIGRYAASLIETGDALILDSGSTTEQIALNLKGKKNLIVMTNGIHIAYQLANQPDIQVMVSGGTIRENSYSLNGQTGEHFLGNYRYQKLFLGVDGFDKLAGITTPHASEAAINRKMVQAAQQVIAVTDSSKFNRQSFCVIAGTQEIDILITDSGIPQDYYHALTQAGIDIHLVDA
ncbi:transcriptional repressor AgaR [Vibrio sp. TRT 17S01]|uniref:transcriptional repressor AgaR n=1 Tax=Vibrio sp. TRT 17S01 TaxID=3418505 RepID=UPI003CF3229E